MLAQLNSTLYKFWQYLLLTA